MYDDSDSSMYGLPTSNPAITKRGKVIRYVSVFPVGRDTFMIAWPTCLTVHKKPKHQHIASTECTYRKNKLGMDTHR